jgi:hypothetical protein
LRRASQRRVDQIPAASCRQALGEAEHLTENSRGLLEVDGPGTRLQREFQTYGLGNP